MNKVHRAMKVIVKKKRGAAYLEAPWVQNFLPEGEDQDLPYMRTFLFHGVVISQLGSLFPFHLFFCNFLWLHPAVWETGTPLQGGTTLPCCFSSGGGDMCKVTRGGVRCSQTPELFGFSGGFL